jgi:phage baseplate assembly protein gpV
MTVSFPFQPQYTWRKLGYLAFTDSLQYREVLEQNPQWSVWELPPIGAQLRLSQAPTTTGTPGGLTQGSFITGLVTGDASDAIYPYDTQVDYDSALYRYTLQGVVDRESLNGITFDSPQAITGIQ